MPTNELEQCVEGIKTELTALEAQIKLDNDSSHGGLLNTIVCQVSQKARQKKLDAAMQIKQIQFLLGMLKSYQNQEQFNLLDISQFIKHQQASISPVIYQKISQRYQAHLELGFNLGGLPNAVMISNILPQLNTKSLMALSLVSKNFQQLTKFERTKHYLWRNKPDKENANKWLKRYSPYGQTDEMQIIRHCYQIEKTCLSPLHANLKEHPKLIFLPVTLPHKHNAKRKIKLSLFQYALSEGNLLVVLTLFNALLGREKMQSVEDEYRQAENKANFLKDLMQELSLPQLKTMDKQLKQLADPNSLAVNYWDCSALLAQIQQYIHHASWKNWSALNEIFDEAPSYIYQLFQWAEVVKEVTESDNLTIPLEVVRVGLSRDYPRLLNQFNNYCLFSSNLEVAVKTALTIEPDASLRLPI